MILKTASISQLKKELTLLPKDELINHCIRLAKHKTENKELLNHLLFLADDEQDFIATVKLQVQNEFLLVNQQTMYLAKKVINRILRLVNKHIKFSATKNAEIELLICFCKHLKGIVIVNQNNTVLSNIYARQLKRIDKALAKLHPDMQIDYQDDLDEIQLDNN